jgi:hypothetical protein
MAVDYALGSTQAISASPLTSSTSLLIGPVVCIEIHTTHKSLFVYKCAFASVPFNRSWTPEPKTKLKGGH